MSSAITFDQSFYLTNNADVVLAISQGHFANALDHYNRFGGKELRAPNASFDPSYYAINNADVLNAVASGVFPNVFAHFQAFGESENRAPNVNLASFDATAYLAANTDVAAAVTAGTFSSALDHFLAFGQNENRTGSGVTAAVNPGQTFTLTTGADSGASFTGGGAGCCWPAAPTATGQVLLYGGFHQVYTSRLCEVHKGAGRGQPCMGMRTSMKARIKTTVLSQRDIPRVFEAIRLSFQIE